MTLKLKKGAIIDIKCKDYIESFERLKVLITSDPILIYPDFSKPFSLTTDASNVAIGVVLSQNHKPVCYASRTLNEHEINYSTIELLAIVWATKILGHTYLAGHLKYLVITSHWYGSTTSKNQT